MSHALDVINVLLAVIPLIFVVLSAIATQMPNCLVRKAETQLSELQDLVTVVIELEMECQISQFYERLSQIRRRFAALRTRNNLAHGLWCQFRAGLFEGLSWDLFFFNRDLAKMKCELELLLDSLRDMTPTRAGAGAQPAIGPGAAITLNTYGPVVFTHTPANFTVSPLGLIEAPPGRANSSGQEMSRSTVTSIEEDADTAL